MSRRVIDENRLLDLPINLVLETHKPFRLRLRQCPLVLSFRYYTCPPKGPLLPLIDGLRSLTSCQFPDPYDTGIEVTNKTSCRTEQRNDTKSGECGYNQDNYRKKCCSDGGPGSNPTILIKNNEPLCEIGTDTKYCGPRLLCPAGSEGLVRPTGSLSGCSGVDSSKPSCMQCSPGKFKAVGPPSNRSAQAQLCQACPSGQYQDRMGATECKGCGPGQYNGIGTQGAPVAACFECPLGRWGNLVGGTSLDSGCFECEAGRFGNTTGASEASKCYQCKLGIEYNDQPGQPACKSAACAQGKYGLGSATSTSSKPSCSNCPKGRYSVATGLTSKDDCSPCPLGTYGVAVGATSRSSGCSLCAVGRFGNTSGANTASECYQCKPGIEYTDLPGQPACKSAACPQGKYGASTATTSSKPPCSNCPKGRYSVATGLVSEDNCSPCPLGTYGIAAGATSRSEGCSPCAAGTFGNTSGANAASKCYQCEPGIEYTDEPGQAACKSAACPQGKYGKRISTTATSKPSCFKCPKGRYSVATGLT